MPEERSSKHDAMPIGVLAAAFAVFFVVFTALALVGYRRNVASERAYRTAPPCSQLSDSTPASNCWYERVATVTGLDHAGARTPATLTLQPAGRQEETFQFRPGAGRLLDSVRVGDIVEVEIWHDHVMRVQKSGISAETTYVPYLPRRLLGWVLILGSATVVLAAAAVGAPVRAYEPGWRRIAMLGVVGLLLGPLMAGVLLVLAPAVPNPVLLSVGIAGAMCCGISLMWRRARRDRRRGIPTPVPNHS